MRKKIRNIALSISAIILIIFLAWDPFNKTYAEEAEVQRENLADGINEMKEDIQNLKKTRIERHEKLVKDIKVFVQNGTEDLDEDNIFFITRKSGFTAEELDNAISDTAFEGIGYAFKQAEDKYGINSIFLIAIAKHESANGTSQLANEKNNLFGFNAIDKDPINAAKKFNNKAESVDYVARFLKENYLDPNGDFYNGLTAKSINKCYASDPNWGDKVEDHMYEVGLKLLEYQQ